MVSLNFLSKPKPSFLDKPMGTNCYHPGYVPTLLRWQQYIHLKARKIQILDRDMVNPDISKVVNLECEDN